jgi:predicted DsbA family dithiol-disulfide isomerase
MADNGDMTIIEVFADVSCPFTHVGLRRFVARRDELGRSDVRLVVRAWPLEIVNGTPLDADLIAEEVDHLRREGAPDLFARFTVAAFPATSMPSLALAAAAYGLSVESGERVSLLLRDLLFERGVDIADPEVLADIALEFGIAIPTDDELVMADHREGAQRGVIGSPHYFTGSGDFFCPALDVGRDADGNLHINANPEKFEQFIRSCFEWPQAS